MPLRTRPPGYVDRLPCVQGYGLTYGMGGVVGSTRGLGGSSSYCWQVGSQGLSGSQSPGELMDSACRAPCWYQPGAAISERLPSHSLQAPSLQVRVPLRQVRMPLFSPM